MDSDLLASDWKEGEEQGGKERSGEENGMRGSNGPPRL